MERKNNAIIFDMDGLLLDTEPLWGESMMAVAQNHGISISYKDLRFTTGMRIYEVTSFWADRFPWTDGTSSKALAEEILDHIIDNAMRNARLMPGVLHHLQFLKTEGYPIGLATSSPKRMMEALIRHYSIEHFFDDTACGDEVEQAKPHPAVYLKAAERLGILPYRCIAVEDSVNGMVAAKAARMKVVVIPETLKYQIPAFGLADAEYRSLADMPTEIWDEL